MTQEEKQLLIKDLCARLLYKPMCHAGKINHDGNLYFINIIYSTVALTSDKAVGKFETCPIVDVKPYLRPISSMTEEERNNLRTYCRTQEGIIYDIGIAGSINSPAIIDFLNTHHFDYRCLIEKGLAIEAPDGMYKTE